MDNSSLIERMLRKIGAYSKCQLVKSDEEFDTYKIGRLKINFCAIDEEIVGVSLMPGFSKLPLRGEARVILKDYILELSNAETDSKAYTLLFKFLIRYLELGNLTSLQKIKIRRDLNSLISTLDGYGKSKEIRDLMLKNHKILF